MIEILGENGERVRNDETALLGFIEHTPNEHTNSPTCSTYRLDSSITESSLDRAIAECNIIRGNPFFSEGVLLKCVDAKRKTFNEYIAYKVPIIPTLFLYLHYALFKNPDHDMCVAQIDQSIRELHGRSKSQFGAYDEIYAIQKSSPVVGCKLPTHRHAGYIVILFKLLDEQTKHESLEKSWLSWSGAREIYKYSPRNWNLRRIALHKLPAPKKTSYRPFAYVLFCEFGNMLNPSNRLQALDMVERLRVRNCGYISLYQVQWSYGRISPETASVSQQLSVPEGRWERNLMLRGFSQEAEPTTDMSVLANTRKRSSQSTRIQNEHYSLFHSYHHFSDFG
uniref:DUF7153 domain-containing protein n=1 Tax=Setaria digitata TaxID=48799 RepID=A0A915Q4K5_9BILA